MHKFSVYPALWESGTYVRGKAIYMNTEQKIRHGIFFLQICEWNIPLAYLYFILSADQSPHLNTEVFLCRLQDKTGTWAWANCTTSYPIFTHSTTALPAMGKQAEYRAPYRKALHTTTKDHSMWLALADLVIPWNWNMWIAWYYVALPTVCPLSYSCSSEDIKWKRQESTKFHSLTTILHALWI